MSYKRIPLLAGQPYRVGIPGGLVLVDTTGAADGVDIVLVRNGEAGDKMPDRRGGFRHVGRFDDVILTVAVDAVVGVFLSFDDVQLGLAEGGAVAIPAGVAITNPAGDPVHVTFTQQIVPLGSVEVNNTDAKAVPIVQKAGTTFTVEQASEVDTRGYLAQTVTNVAPVNVTEVGAVMLAAAVARRGFRVRNVGANPVAIGGDGVAFAGAVALVYPGETWNENEAPGAAWHAICEAGMTSTLNVMVIA